MISGGSDAVRHMGVIAHLHICVGSARCSSYYDGHMPEPLTVGRAMVRYPRFFCIPVRPRVSVGHKRTKTYMPQKTFIVRVKQAKPGIPAGATVEVISNGNPPMIHEIHAAFQAKYGSSTNGNGYDAFEIRPL